MSPTAGIARAMAIAIVVCSVAPCAARASDRWEFGSSYRDDDHFTINELVHPAFQPAHDFEGQGDQDWFITQTHAGHSYEARVRSSTIPWGPFIRFDRVDAAGVVITPGVGDGAPVVSGALRATLTVRWAATADAVEFLRTDASIFSLGAQDQYDLEFADTTYFAPRFNNTSTQFTILIVQNTTPAPLTGDILFYSAPGVLLGTSPLSLAANGTQVLNTSTIPALAGQSGSLAISHLGSYGALTGKAVALEPATGFTFDTALTPLPR